MSRSAKISSRSEVFLAKVILKNMQQIYRRTPMPKCDLNKVKTTLFKSHFGIGVLL